MRMCKERMIGLVMILTLAMAGCDGGGGGGGGGGGTPDPDEGQTFQTTVMAATGGTVETESGSASVDIPAGALDGDTEITVTVEAPDGDTASSIYDFGPDGTVFNVPVTIGIDYEGTPGTEKKAVLAWHDGQKWVEIPGSDLEGGTVTGEIDHFTKFSIIIVDDKLVLVSDCAEVPAEFVACGGDLIGTWTFADICFEDQVLGENPFEENCPEATAEFEMDYTGSMTIDATTITQNMETMSMSSHFEVPLTCMVDGQCTALNDEENMTCQAEGELCVCDAAHVQSEFEPMVMTYTIDGNNLLITDEDGTDTVPYCRQGDSAVVKIIDEDEGDVTVWYMVLDKQ